MISDTSAGSRTRVSQRILITVAVAALIDSLCLMTAPGHWTLWAEDGSIFMTGAWREGFAALPEAYAGYLHTVPRLIAALAAMVPVPATPAVVTFVSLAVLAACSWLCASRLRNLITMPWALYAFAAFLVAGPAAVGEVAGNLTNLHWVLTLTAFVVLWQPGGRTRPRADIAGGLVCLLAALSDPVAVVALAPVAVRVLRASRTPADQPGAPRSAVGRAWRQLRAEGLALLGLAAGLAVQAAVVLASTRMFLGVSSWREAGTAFLASWGAATLYGRDLSTGAASVIGFAPVIVSGVVIVAAVWAAALRQFRGLQLLTSAIVAAVTIGAAVVLSWSPLMVITDGSLGLRRHVYVAAALTAVPILLLTARGRPAWRRVTGTVAVIALAAGTVAAVESTAANGRQPSWGEQVQLARATCAAGGAEAAIRVPPNDQFTAAVPCDLLR